MAFKLINDEIIIHIPKTGTRSLYYALTELNVIKKEYDRHMSIREVKSWVEDLGEVINDDSSDGTKFLIQVRNPYDRFLSMYNHLFFSLYNFPEDSAKLSQEEIDYIEELSLNEFVDFLIKPDKRKIFISKVRTMIKKKGLRQQYDPALIYKTQSSFLTGHITRTLRIFKLEDKEIWKYLNHLGYNVQEIHHGQNIYKKEFDLTDGQREIIANFYRSDFRRFFYDRNSEIIDGLYPHS